MVPAGMAAFGQGRPPGPRIGDGMADFCAEHGLDLTLIETMPLGAGVLEREERYIALDDFTAPLRALYDFHPLAHKYM